MEKDTGLFEKAFELIINLEEGEEEEEEEEKEEEEMEDSRS